MSKKIIVVGGGAAGMMAAISAKTNGGQVTILERQNRVGKKILATGNGRCNYTNTNLSIENYHGKNPKFAYSALSTFGVEETIDFFERLGITPAIEEAGKVFPLSFQSSSVLDVLRMEIERLGIGLETDAFVSSIKKKEDFIVGLKDGRKFRADRLILATGGMALPSSGSDGNGYSLAKSLGHRITDIFPGLVQLKLEANIFKQVKGVKFLGRVGLYLEDKLILEDYGDVLFTDYGISGPPILQVSRTALEHLRQDRDVRLRLSIIRIKTVEELASYLIERFSYMPERKLSDALIGLINKRLIIPILR